MERFWDKDNETINTELNSVFKDMEASIKPRQQKYIKWYKLYNGIIDPENMREEGANLFIQYTMPTIDTLISRCLQALFRQKPYVVVDPKKVQFKENAKYMQALIEDQIDNKINIVEKWYNMLLEVFLYGTSLPYTDWKLEKKTVKKWQEVIIPLLNIKMGRQAVKKEIVVYDAPFYEITDIFNVYVPSTAKEIRDAEPIAIKTYITPQEYKERLERGIYKDGEDLNDESNPLEEIEQVRLQKQNISDAPNKNRIKVINFYYNERTITQINGKRIVRNEENASFSMEKPFDRVMWHPMPNEFWGKSLVDAVESLQEELNTTRNQRIDNVSLVLNKLFKYNRNSDIDPNTIKSKPGHAIPVGDLRDIEAFDIPDVTASAYREESIIKQDIEFITFVNDYAMGRTTPGSSDETATAVRNKTAASNINFNTVVMMLNATGLMPLYDKLIKLNYQYFDRPESLPIPTDIGTEETVDLTWDKIQGDYGLIPANPNFELPMSKEAKRADLIGLLDTISRVNPQVLQLINFRAYMKKLFELYDIKDYEELLAPIMNPASGQIPGQTPPQIAGPVGQPANTQIPSDMGVEQNGFS